MKLYTREIHERQLMLDSVTGAHSKRVAKYAENIEKEFGYKDTLLSQAAEIHDIGKLYVPQMLLNKPGRLTPMEKSVVDLHPYWAFLLLEEECPDNFKGSYIYEELKAIVLMHHGPDYKRIKDLNPLITDVTLEYAVVLRTIDSYEALTTDRAYRRGKSRNEAIEIIRSEGWYHPRVLEYLIEESNRKDALYFDNLDKNQYRSA